MNTKNPYKKGYLEVSDGNKLYYELCGNPDGIPVLFIHGGPGEGFSEKDKDFFNPEICNIMLFDQRGARRSKPFATLENNTTQKLIEDIQAFLNFVGVEKTFLFGGSWGSTLSLAYAIQYPQKVSGMLLRGVWLATQSDKYYYIGGGIQTMYPEVWERFINLVPQDERDNADTYYLSQMQSPDKTISEKYTYEWAYYEMSLLRLKTTEEQVKKDMEEFNYRSLAPLEAYYISNNCFLSENFIIDNAAKLSDIPTTIVHGRYDTICPPKNAYLLHKAIKNSKLIYTTAGHASTDEENKKVLVEEMERFSKEFNS